MTARRLAVALCLLALLAGCESIRPRPVQRTKPVMAPPAPIVVAKKAKRRPHAAKTVQAVDVPVPKVDLLYVVAHADVALSLDEVRELFLGDAPAGGAVLAVDNAAAQALFLERLLKVAPEQYEKRWSRRAFRDGAQPPAKLDGDAAVLDYVRANAGTVGYVHTPAEDLRILGTLP